jgi:hypothetical protein
MSFDVFLVPLQNVDASERRAAVLGQLAGRNVRLDDNGWASVNTPDGGEAEVDIDEEPEWGGSVSIYGLSREIAELVHETAAAGELAVVPAAEPPVTLVVDASHQARLAENAEERDVIVCPDPAALHESLGRGYARFADYRRAVLDDLTK